MFLSLPLKEGDPTEFHFNSRKMFELHDGYIALVHCVFQKRETSEHGPCPYVALHAIC